jgi:hypothetical protein
MNETSTILLKKSFESLIQNNDDQFKKSLSIALSMKLNENIEYLRIHTQKKLFEPVFKFTPKSQEIKNFVEFLESYDPLNPSKIKLKNESVINITEKELKDIKILFDQLSPKNRTLMVESIFESKANLDQHLEFCQKVKVLQK